MLGELAVLSIDARFVEKKMQLFLDKTFHKKQVCRSESSPVEETLFFLFLTFLFGTLSNESQKLY